MPDEPRVGEFWIRREPSRRGVRTVVYINRVGLRNIGTRHVDQQITVRGINYNIQSSWHNKDVFLTNYMVAAPSEIPDYYFGRVENVVENTPRRPWDRQVTIIDDTFHHPWSDSIIHNAYDYIMGNKQPKEKPQRKRKGFATFVVEKGL